MGHLDERRDEHASWLSKRAESLGCIEINLVTPDESLEDKSLYSSSPGMTGYSTSLAKIPFLRKWSESGGAREAKLSTDFLGRMETPVTKGERLKDIGESDRQTGLY